MPVYRCTPRFEEAVLDYMAKSPKSIQERLVDAMHHLIGCTMERDLPRHLMPQMDALIARTTSVDPARVDIAGDFKGQGSITATCMTMSDAEAVKVAQMIIDIHRELDALSRRD